MSAPQVFREVTGLPDEKSGRKGREKPIQTPLQMSASSGITSRGSRQKIHRPVTPSGISIYRDPVV
jgi:hypothetical protein